MAGRGTSLSELASRWCRAARAGRMHESADAAEAVDGVRACAAQSAGGSCGRVMGIAGGKDERGASILIALFYFLVCAMVGSVVLTAATVTTGQLADFEKSQQAYYSVSSAAELFGAAIEGQSCTRSGDTWTCVLASEQSGESTTSLGAWLAKSVRDIYAGNEASPAEVQVTLQPQAKGINGVTAKLTMNPENYSLHVSVALSTYTGTGSAYQVACDIPAALQYGDGEYRTIEKVTWEKAVVSKQAEATA